MSIDQIKEDFPFKAYMTFKKQSMDSEELVDIFAEGKDDKEKCIELVKGYFAEIQRVFDRLRELSPLEVIRDEK